MKAKQPNPKGRKVAHKKTPLDELGKVVGAYTDIKTGTPMYLLDTPDGKFVIPVSDSIFL